MREMMKNPEAHLIDEDKSDTEDEGNIESANFVESSVDDEDISTFIIADNVNFNVGKVYAPHSSLIFYSGATKSTVSNLSMLIDTQIINKSMRTYSGSIQITHVGSLPFGQYKIFPVYYAPEGKCNLVSMSQLEDHGFQIGHKNRMVLVRMGDTIIQRFPRVNDLYVSTFSPINKKFNSDAILNLTPSNNSTDWHITLGHPSDEYLKKFLKLNNIKSIGNLGSSKHCDICKSAKLTQAPHSHHLPTADRPFYTLHMDVLQINP